MYIPTTSSRRRKQWFIYLPTKIRALQTTRICCLAVAVSVVMIVFRSMEESCVSISSIHYLKVPFPPTFECDRGCDDTIIVVNGHNCCFQHIIRLLLMLETANLPSSQISTSCTRQTLVFHSSPNCLCHRYLWSYQYTTYLRKHIQTKGNR